MGNLSHTHILVTRAASQSSHFAALLRSQGAQVLEMPTISIIPPSSWSGLDDAISQLDSFDWLILTSANAVIFFLQRLQELGYEPSVLSGIKIAVVGNKTASVLAQHQRQPDFVPPNFVADALVDHFPEPLLGQRVLFPRVESGGRAVLVQAFRAQEAEIVEVPAYESACPEAVGADVLMALKERQLDIITFASSKTVRHFVQLVAKSLGDSWLEQLAGVAIASIGPQTSKTCHELLGRVDVEAQEYTLEGLTAAIVASVSGAAV